MLTKENHQLSAQLTIENCPQLLPQLHGLSAISGSDADANVCANGSAEGSSNAQSCARANGSGDGHNSSGIDYPDAVENCSRWLLDSSNPSAQYLSSNQPALSLVTETLDKRTHASTWQPDPRYRWLGEIRAKHNHSDGYPFSPENDADGYSLFGDGDALGSEATNGGTDTNMQRFPITSEFLRIHIYKCGQMPYLCEDRGKFAGFDNESHDGDDGMSQT
ncbi:hypothetical protein H4R20_005255 [Coemansia guatemalensis]|uniref:Uncharacterized protein n=1 Tax=Coemansia guatemalensis TaxID=2761395 RepID=A0A9W8HRS4_9FUNG|nr:hypothetical protein H4R20_005255 [Coemansia guatemalensis]